MTTAQPRELDVIIVSYKCRELVAACLASLHENAPALPMNVWVVDNASGDGTVEMLGSLFPEVHAIASRENLGFGRATNLGITQGRGMYVLALNPDTGITRGALDRMIAVMDARPEIGIAGCKLQLEDGSFDHAARRAFPTPLSAFGHFTGIGRREGMTGRLAAYRAPEVAEGPVDAVNGAFMLIRRAALAEVGLFDEGYWMYMEDLDLSYRFAERGWLTWYEPSVTVMHVKSATSGRYRQPKLNYAFHYGMFRFYRKFYADGHAHAFNALIYLGIAAKLTASVAHSSFRRRFSRSRGTHSA
jgi:GT2 family glycosyltransferase